MNDIAKILLRMFFAVCVALAACSGERTVPATPDGGPQTDAGTTPFDAATVPGPEDAGTIPDGGGGGRETHAMHLTLTKNSWLPEDEEFVLVAGGDEHPLKRHDAASMATYDHVFDALADLQEPTHYVESVDLPSDRVTLLHVRQRSDRTGLVAAAHGAGVPHAMGLVFIHIPDAARDKALAQKRAALRAKGIIKEGEMAELFPAEVDTYGPWDIAQSLVFHHPDLMNLDPDHAANIMVNHIEEAVGLDALAAAIQDAGPYGWYTQRPIYEEDGVTPVLDSSGEPMFTYQIIDEVKNAASTAVLNALNGANNDATLKGQSYNPTEGVSHTTETGESPPDGTAPPPLRGGGYKYSLANEGFKSGFKSSVSASGQDIHLTLRNDYVRHLSTFIEFYDEDDDPVSPDGWESKIRPWADIAAVATLETSTRKFLALNNPVPTIMGIPVAGDFNNSHAYFTWPMDARYAKIRAGGLGNGGDNDKQVVVMGATLTSMFELAIPSILLATSVGMGKSAYIIEALADDVSLAGTVVSVLYSVIYGHGDPSIGNLAATIGVAAGDFVWRNKTIRKKLVQLIAQKQCEKAIPFIGWGLWAADVAATAAVLAQTSAEVASSPWIIENRLGPTHDINVRINHDPDNYQFPATATRFKVLAKFSKSDTRVFELALPTDPATGYPITVSSTREVTFRDAPAGGHFDIEVLFYSDTGWLAGQAVIEDIPNVNDPGKDDLTIEFPIEENLVPLDASSVYRHKVILGYKEAEATYYWHGTPDPPTATYRDLSNATTGRAMSGLGNTTISQTTGMFGYVWRAYYAGQKACPGNAGGGHLYFLRNINLAEDPNQGMMFSTCGYANQPYMLYEFLPKDKAGAQNWVVIEEYGRYWVHRMEFSDDGEFHMPTSVGYFPIEVHSMVAHPSGVLIAINNAYAKMFVLPLLDRAKGRARGTDDQFVPAAVPVAGPALSLRGAAANPSLLRHPIAIKLTPENSVVVLDDVHELTAGTIASAVQAQLKVFTPEGTPVRYFNGEFALDLKEPDADRAATYLDFGFESQGYIYTLSYSYPRYDPSYKVTAADYHLDIYKPDGAHLVRTPGFAAARMTVDKWRNVFTLNYQMVPRSAGMAEPTVSEWIPPTPEGGSGADAN